MSLDLNAALAHLTAHGSLPKSAWPAGGLTPGELGLHCDAAGDLFWPESVDRLDASAIARAFADHVVCVLESIDSTNSYLLQLGTSVDKVLCAAELQTGGRGRRGRSWISPYARNLAMSLGASINRPLGELGGLSSVVGLALVDELQAMGIDGVALKWPNDVLVGGGKLCGILVELVHHADHVECVVGIGVNVALTDMERAAIGQPVSDLRRCGVDLSRSDLLICLLKKVSEYLLHFELNGFEPFVDAFNAAHLYHAQACEIHLGDTVVAGTVAGIGVGGELILRTAEGEARFHGGEVSLRAPRVDAT